MDLLGGLGCWYLIGAIFVQGLLLPWKDEYRYLSVMLGCLLRILAFRVSDENIQGLEVHSGFFRAGACLGTI